MATLVNEPDIINTAWDGLDTLYGVNGQTLFSIKNGQMRRIEVDDCAPVAVTVDRQGALWLLDDLHKRVMMVDRQGAVQLAFGSKGRGTGTFKAPSDIAVSAEGIVYVADPAYGWVQIFNRDGIFLNVINQGEQNVLFGKPAALALNEDDTLHVLDRQLKKVFIYSSQGRLLSQFGQTGDFDDPVDLFVTANEIFILDAGTRNIKVFSDKGHFLRSFGAFGRGRGDFNQPVAISGRDTISFFVTDLKNRTIQHLSTIYSPAIVQGLSAVGAMRQIRLAWQIANEPFVEGYHLFRAEALGGPYELMATVDGGSYVDSLVQPGKPYYYRVAAQARQGNMGRASQEAFSIPEKFSPAQPHALEGEAQEWQIRLAWQVKAEEEALVEYFRVLRKEKGEEYSEVGRIREAAFTDSGLAADTVYFYQVVAVGIDGDQSRPAALEIKTRLAQKSPLEIEVVDVRNLFSNTYKLYEEIGLGTVRLTNNTGAAIANIKLLFTMKEYMDFPSELTVDALGPGAAVELLLTPIFNNRILSVTEDTSIQTELVASYYENNRRHQFSRTVPVNVFEKHRMIWDDHQRFATFITPKDPVLLEFVRAVVTPVADAVEPMQRAAVIFAAVGRLGLTYLPDPTNPYQETSEDTDLVDYIQYPRETLERRSGDCDDLVALYASALESVGIETLVVEVPGHMLMMFDSGVAAEEGSDTMDELFVAYGGRMWVPVETTLVGSDFMKAWQQGSRAYYQAAAGNTLSLLDLRRAWRIFKPASLPPSDWRPPAVDPGDEQLVEELGRLKRIALSLRCREYVARLEKDPADLAALIQLGILQGRAGELGAAKKAFGTVLSYDSRNSDALNNFGNIYFLEEDYQAAAKMYEQSLAHSPDDALIHVNLARSYQAANRRDEAVAAFRTARELDPAVSREHRALSLELLARP